MSAHRIFLLRHAKSDWKDTGVVDHERPLNKRGRRSAAELPATLQREHLQPGLVLVSTARRAQETAEQLGLDLTAEPKLYNASAGELLTRVRALADSVPSVMLVGHNPGMEDLANWLGDTAGMSTATLLAFDVDAPTWAELDVTKSRAAGRWEHPGEK
jgi:phosphohistidine phosphatase